MKEAKDTLQHLDDWAVSLFSADFCLLIRPDFLELAYKVVETADDMMQAHQKSAAKSWHEWVRTAFAKGAGAAHRASKAKALEAAVTLTDDSQPYQLAEWKTSVGPTRLHPRAFWYLSRPGLVALCALCTACERLLMWPSDRIVNDMVRLAKPDGGTRLITLVESLARLWSRTRRSISRAWIREHGSRHVWGDRRGFS